MTCVLTMVMVMTCSIIIMLSGYCFDSALHVVSIILLQFNLKLTYVVET